MLMISIDIFDFAGLRLNSSDLNEMVISMLLSDCLFLLLLLLLFFFNYLHYILVFMFI